MAPQSGRQLRTEWNLEIQRRSQRTKPFYIRTTKDATPVIVRNGKRTDNLSEHNACSLGEWMEKIIVRAQKPRSVFWGGDGGGCQIFKLAQDGRLGEHVIWKFHWRDVKLFSQWRASHFPSSLVSMSIQTFKMGDIECCGQFGGVQTSSSRSYHADGPFVTIFEKNSCAWGI